MELFIYISKFYKKNKFWNLDLKSFIENVKINLEKINASLLEMEF